MTKKRVIALVDDDACVLRGFSRLLRAHGFTVMTFASGTEFLASLACAVPDCAILDVKMPEMSGLEVAAKLRTQGRKVPLIFVTACPMEKANEIAAGCGVAVLQKPVRSETLCTAIRSASDDTEQPDCPWESM